MLDIFNFISIWWNYFLPLFLSLGGVIRIIRLNLEEDGNILYFREFILGFSAIILSLMPCVNFVMALYVVFYFFSHLMDKWFNFLESQKKKVVFDFNRRNKHDSR